MRLVEENVEETGCEVEVGRMRAVVQECMKVIWQFCFV